ncbi:MAG: PotD/PotF family extracellular solute-binding protein, partial [Lachnospirales bacterium]
MKKFLSSLLAISILLMTVGCGTSQTATGDSTTTDEEINVFVWTEYIPQSVIDSFTEETGIKVNVSTFSSNEDMLAKVKAESEDAFDIIQPSDYMVEQCISQDMLLPLDMSKLSNFENIGEAYKNPSYDPSNKYSVPYLGGVAGIAVNKANITDEIDSYADLFDSKYAGQLVALDDYRAVIGMAAKSLGYSFNETDPAKLEEIKSKVLELKNNIKL